MKKFIFLPFLIFILIGCTELDVPETNVRSVTPTVVEKSVEEVPEAKGVEKRIVEEVEIKEPVVEEEKPQAKVEPTEVVEVFEKVLKSIVESKPIEELSVKTIKPKPIKQISDSNCHPSYSGCLKKNAGDYDCAGGSGNGPNYTGRVRVVGVDVFGLDRDNDGWGCEKVVLKQ